jgi:hypothetical protein
MPTIENTSHGRTEIRSFETLPDAEKFLTEEVKFLTEEAGYRISDRYFYKDGSGDITLFSDSEQRMITYAVHP